MNWISETLSFYKYEFSFGNENDYNDYSIINKPKPTLEELKILNIEVKKYNCKNTAKQKIFDCDWSVLPDVKISNKSDFENYRSQLRNYILNPVENPVFPEEPKPIWIQPDIIIGENNG